MGLYEASREDQIEMLALYRYESTPSQSARAPARVDTSSERPAGVDADAWARSEHFRVG